MSDINQVIADIKFDLTIFDTTTQANIVALLTAFESQKEEIEKLNRRMERLAETSVDISVHESLKAITELAVKGLKEIQDYQRDQNESSLHSYDNCKIWAKSTLSEIEKLQNG